MPVTGVVSIGEDSTVLAEIVGLAASGLPITAGVTVTVTIYANGDHSTVWTTATLKHVGNGTWRAWIDPISGLSEGDVVDVCWKADGGPSQRATWWARRVRVHQRSAWP